ncbi:hypothetical protein [Nitrosomonas communis]|uniref:hypothetical protein n=1 Tax=Nitrosomonas communis TaxID=44574 RepID=UPI0009423404|nr:hypothetical protein [Nitrosomonas communis]
MREGIADPIQNDSKCTGGKELLVRTTFAFSDGFGLGLFLLDDIELWRIRQQIFKRVPGIGKGGFDILPL